MSALIDTIIASLPQSNNTASSGWTYFNAPCCYQTGHRPDTKKSGKVIQDSNGIKYYCSNCGYEASWQTGCSLSRNIKIIMKWLNISEDHINKIEFDLLKQAGKITTKKFKDQFPTFETKALLEGAIKVSDITDVCKYSLAVLEFMEQRKLTLDDTDYYWSPHPAHRDKLIIPYFYENRIVGYITRFVQWSEKEQLDKSKYLRDVEPGYVFNLDAQDDTKEFVIVCEGEIDALHVGGCAIGGGRFIFKQQVMQLARLNKPIIYVPDRDREGRKMILKAMELGWQVSMPNWSKKCRDIGDAVVVTDRLETFSSIIESAEQCPTKINLKAKTWFHQKLQ